MLFLSYMDREKDLSLLICKQPFTRNELKLGIIEKGKFLLVKGNYQLGTFIKGEKKTGDNRKIFDSLVINDDKEAFEKYRELLSEITATRIDNDMMVLQMLEENKTLIEKEIDRKWKTRLQKRRKSKERIKTRAKAKAITKK